MKKLLLYVIFILIQHMVFGQHQLDSVVRIVDGAKFITVQKYDTAKKQLEILHYEIKEEEDDMQWKDRFWTQYDAFENELVHIHSDWDSVGGEWAEKEKREKQYDDSNRMICHTEYQMQEGKWMGITKGIQEFGDQTVTITDYRGVKGHWIPDRKNFSQFNENSDEILVIHDQWDSIASEWGHQMKQESDFSSDTLLKEITSYTWKDGKWTNSEKVAYKYAPDTDEVTDRVVHAGTADGWKLKSLIQTEYFDSAKREEIYEWSEADDAWKLEALSESYLDRYGRETDFLYKSDKYGVHFQRLILFDGEGRITLSQEIGFENNNQAFGTQTLFKFDEDGDLYRQTTNSLDVENAHWVGQEIREFTFDKGIILRDGRKDNVLDKANIGDANSWTNKHAITTATVHRLVDGKMVLQHETTYYYSILRD